MTTLFEKNHLLKAPPLLQILFIYYNYTILKLWKHVRELVAVMHKTWKCINLDSGDIWLLDVGLLTDNHGK